MKGGDEDVLRDSTASGSVMGGERFHLMIRRGG